ncbi:hypothetical protein PM082_014984 [Marasmius tenuissimus]|nr:hypothetical protein PM082_014984 [Marasmius tenuissimus]
MGPNGTIKGQDMIAWMGKEKKRMLVPLMSLLSNESSSPPKLALIVGLSIGAIALLSIGVTFGVFYGKRKRSQRKHNSRTEGHPALLTPYPPSAEVSGPETRLREKDIRQPRDSGKTRDPEVGTETEERRFIRHEDSGIMLEGSSYGTGFRSESIIQLPPTYSEVKFVH